MPVHRLTAPEADFCDDFDPAMPGARVTILQGCWWLSQQLLECVRRMDHLTWKGWMGIFSEQKAANQMSASPGIDHLQDGFLLQVWPAVKVE